MELDGLKISGDQSSKPQQTQKPAEEKPQKPQNTEDTDLVVEGTSVGGDILKKIKKLRVVEEEEVIYGVYNNADKGVFVRINDFMVDRSKVSLKDKSYFFHMLAVMVDAGIPVVQAVKSLASRAENKRFKRILNTIGYNCEHGSTLADAMSRFENVFDESEMGIVKSGEATGRLNVMLFKLSSQLDNRYELNSKLWGAAVYPIAVLGVLILVATGMLVWIFPTLLNLLKESGAADNALPMPTKVLIFVQGAMVDYWPLMLIVALGIYGMFSVYVKSDYGATKWDYFKLKVPVVGTLIRKVFVLRFVGMLGLLIESGLPVISSLKITGNSLSNRLYKLKSQELIDSVRNGQKISTSMRDSEFLFPLEVVEMLRIGEASASLGKISEKISSHYQREINNSIKKMTSVFEPVMILVVGLFVALLALAIMAPIFNLSNIVGS